MAKKQKRWPVVFILSVVLGLVVVWSLRTYRLNVNAADLTVHVAMRSVADAYVSSDRSGQNFGTLPELRSDVDMNQISYMKFDLSALAGKILTSATLKITTDADPNSGSGAVHAFYVNSDSAWTETGVTYASKPGLGARKVGTLEKTASNTAYSVPLDISVLQNEMGKLVTIETRTTSSDALLFYSREAQIGFPELILTYQDQQPMVTPTPISSGGGQRATIVAAGDIVCASNAARSTACQQQATATLVNKLQPSAVLALGDEQYDSGQYAAFQNYYESSWGVFKNITYPVPGNHEYGTSGAKGYFDYYNGVGQAGGRAGLRGQGYYSFDVAGWHIIALNSNCSLIGGCQVGSAEERWLRNDLIAHPAACTLAFWHHPLFTSGTREGVQDVKPLYQALYDANADVVLNGHSHFYERFMPQTPNGVLDQQRGITQFVVGTGGKEILNLGNKTYPNMVLRNTHTFGVLKLILRDGAMDFQFMPIAGQTFTDSGSVMCH